MLSAIPAIADIGEIWSTVLSVNPAITDIGGICGAISSANPTVAESGKPYNSSIECCHYFKLLSPGGIQLISTEWQLKKQASIETQ